MSGVGSGVLLCALNWEWNVRGAEGTVEESSCGMVIEGAGRWGQARQGEWREGGEPH